MKNYMIIFSFLYICILSFVSCETDSGIYSEPYVEDPPAENVHQWIYSKMCEWYLWNEDVKAKTPYYHLDHERFFYSLLSSDRNDGKRSPGKSYYYSYLERSIANTRVDETASSGYGFDYGLVVRQTDAFTDGVPRQYVYAIVKWVREGTPAYAAGLRRGDHIGSVNNVRMTLDNYHSLYGYLEYGLSGIGTVELGVYDLIWEGAIFENSGHSYHLANEQFKASYKISAAEFNNSPILKSGVIDDGPHRVGYLCYNAFERGRSNVYENEMKSVFHEFKNSGVDKLVLDLRYNRGGYVSTLQLLASMIVGPDLAGATFMRLKYNDDIIRKYGNASYDLSLRFLSIAEMSGSSFGEKVVGVNLGMNEIYVLTSSATASTSEALINCLSALGVKVNIIGCRTEGKNVGVHEISSRNGHGGDYDGYEYTLYPVAFMSYNCMDEADYTDGFAPDIYSDEYDDIVWLDLGDRNEKLLSTALYHIRHGHYPVQTRSLENIETKVCLNRFTKDIPAMKNDMLP